MPRRGCLLLGEADRLFEGVAGLRGPVGQAEDFGAVGERVHLPVEEIGARGEFGCLAGKSFGGRELAALCEQSRSYAPDADPGFHVFGDGPTGGELDRRQSFGAASLGVKGITKGG